jgi:hypothetical protein
MGSATSVLLCYPWENAHSKYLLMFISCVECISLLRGWKAVAEHRSPAAQMPRVLSQGFSSLVYSPLGGTWTNYIGDINYLAQVSPYWAMTIWVCGIWKIKSHIKADYLYKVPYPVVWDIWNEPHWNPIQINYGGN